MDQELRVYLEEMEARMAERFVRLESRVDERFEKVDERFDKVDQRFEKVDERFDKVDQRFDKVDERFEKVDERFDKVDQRSEKVDQRFEGLETEARHTRILVEGLSSDLRVLGEGVMGVSERLDDYKAETVKGFDEVKAMLSPYYRNLEERSQNLESDVRYLDRRLKVLEGRAERQTEDVLDTIRKKYGKPQS